MQVRSWMMLSAMATLFGVSGAEAGPATPTTLDKISLDIGSFFAPSQMNVDGAVYGVRARGHGTIGIVDRPLYTSASVTPGPCSDPGVGWCNTPHNIAKSTFGWDFHAKGAGVVIGIVDTGIDLNHPDFAGRVLPGHCIKSSLNDCANRNNKLGGDLAVFPGGDETHGTHVAGIAAGTKTGLATRADLLPVKVCSSNSSGCSGVDEGLVWAAQHGADVINISIGGPSLSSSDVAAFRQAASAGALMVVAAGNSGTKYPTGGFLAGGAMADGVRGSMIVVGATESGGVKGVGEAVSFSQVPGNRCEIHGGHKYCMKDFFVTAPGSDIWSTVGNGKSSGATYGYLSGTSMATPYVTGVAALVKGQSPQLTAKQVAEVIFESADDIGAKGIDPIYGHGAVDVTKALSPLGGAEVRVATGAGTPSQAKGQAGALTSYVSGPLAVAVRNSTMLKHAYVVDKFGRAFQTNLTNAATLHDYRTDYLFNSMMGSQFTSASPFVFAGAGPFGNFVASGYAVGTTTPRLLSGEFLDADRTQYSVRDLAITTPLMEGMDLNLGYNMNVSGRFNEYDASASPAYDGLFMSAAAVNSPYLSLTDGGAFVGTTIALADDLHLRFGESALTPQRNTFVVPTYSLLAQVQGNPLYYDQRAATASMAGLTWDFAKWGGLGVTASQTSEQDGLLGGLDSGALNIANSANTSAVGISARVGFGDGWVTTASYNEGITQLDLRATGLATSADTLRSRAYGVAVAKHGLFDKDDSLGLAVTRPLQVYSGSINLTAADAYDASTNLLSIGRERVSLASSAPETDLELGYVTTFLDGSVALQANAAYQMNFQGQSGTNALTVLSRAKINF